MVMYVCVRLKEAPGKQEPLAQQSGMVYYYETCWNMLVLTYISWSMAVALTVCSMFTLRAMITQVQVCAEPWCILELFASLMNINVAHGRCYAASPV